MKNESTKKITTLSVVIFSFASVLLYFLIWCILSVITDFLVLKTNLPESFLKIGSVVAGGAGMIISAAFLVSKISIKGIYGTAIMFALTIVIKVIGNMLLGLGGYFNLTGLIGMMFMLIFAMIGGTLGGMLKKK